MAVTRLDIRRAQNSPDIDADYLDLYALGRDLLSSGYQALSL